MENVKVILHEISDLYGTVEILPGVYYGGIESDNLESSNIAGQRVRRYYGTAEWFSGQLDGELRLNYWDLNNSGNYNDVFATSDYLYSD